jgi:hypothetical protein
MAVTLASQLQTVTQSQLFTTALQVLQAAGFPVQSWQTGGVERTRLMAFTSLMSDFVNNYIPAYVGGGFTSYATGGWMDLLMQQFYNLTRNGAVNTIGNITLTSAAGVSSQTYAAGKLTAVFGTSGNRYLNTGTVVIPAGPGSVSAPFRAEFAAASYNDPSSSGNITLVTPIPGVTLTNPAGNYTTQTHTGSGTGTLTLGGSPSGPHSVVINVTSTGASGVASFSYNLDGAAAVSLGVVSSVTNLGGVGINITFVNGGSGTSFVQNDTYSFNTPGSWITTQGADAEIDTAGGTRCTNRWSSLSAIPTSSLYTLLAQSTPSVGAQVTQCTVVPDATINNKVNIIVSGPGGVLPSPTISAIQAYITPYARGTDNPVVQSPTSSIITIAANIAVSTSQLNTAQAAITTALSNYLASAGVNPTLRISAVIDLIMNVAGVVDVTGVTINGAAANLTLGGVSSFVLPAQVGSGSILSLSYVTV